VVSGAGHEVEPGVDHRTSGAHRYRRAGHPASRHRSTVAGAH
jgi:hypothetical protein